MFIVNDLEKHYEYHLLYFGVYAASCLGKYVLLYKKWSDITHTVL